MSAPRPNPEGIDPDLLIADPARLDALERTRLLDTPPEETFDRMTRLAAKVLGVPVAFIALVDRHRDYYKSHFGFADPLASVRQIEGRTFCHYTIGSSAPFVLDDAAASPTFRNVPTVQSLGVRAYAGIPLVTPEGCAIGSFCAVDFKPRKWSDLDIEILTELSRSALREINLRLLVDRTTQLNAQLTRANHELQALATTDALTGLRNRHYLDRRLAENVDLLARSPLPLSLLLIDADHFKRINDTYGHPEGDRVLQRVARLLEAHCRKSDILARYGGEEFAVILPNSDYAGAVRAAERFRSAVEQAGAGGPMVTISVGAATAPGGTEARPCSRMRIVRSTKPSRRDATGPRMPMT